MKSVLITGCAGFIGSHLSNRFLNDGWKVHGCDDFSSSKRTSSHFRKLKSRENFSFTEVSIEDNESLRYYEQFVGNINLILNFACPASPPRYQEIPIKTLMTCFNGTKNVLELAKIKKSRVVHASTSEVYGDPVTSPQKETDWGNVNCYGSRSCYDEGKRVAESIIFEFSRLDVDVRLVRIFNTYGPHLDPDDGRVVTNFIKQALSNTNITIYGDGSQTRSFCYVDDLVEGIVRISKLENNPRTPLNLGNPNEFTIIELASKVIKLLPNSSSRIIFEKLPQDDPQQRRPDITSARTILNWNPKIDLDEGLTRTIAYMKNILMFSAGHSNSR